LQKRNVFFSIVLQLHVLKSFTDIQAPLHLPRNITLGKPAPDFVRNSLNITLYWLPPVDQVDFDTFTVKYFKLTHPRRDHNSLRRIQGTVSNKNTLRSGIVPKIKLSVPT